MELGVPIGDRLARRYQHRGEPLDDLTQVARLGIVEAVDRFDPQRRYAFVSFAVATVLGELKRHFRDSTWALHVTRDGKERRARLVAASDELFQRLGRTPTRSEVATELGVGNDVIEDGLLADSAYRPTTVDDGASSALELPAAECRDYDEIDDAVGLAPALRQLSSAEQKVLVYRFVLELTQSEIAARLGVSQMQVSRELRQALEALRAALRGP